jgi:ABC-type dipeptide/oligopeptide/nickel transport system permease component
LGGVLLVSFIFREQQVSLFSYVELSFSHLVKSMVNMLAGFLYVEPSFWMVLIMICYTDINVKLNNIKLLFNPELPLVACHHNCAGLQ